ncbi:unnamed protein product [Prorocentrum cordatum]|uniref:Uncharacterized protein n=1 Tax=Prorocentrum cordatum TaxID=2364126 RepID=A0ABN9R0Z2_9DINO|nr:unnamed protein product [Polarella glacialis]
MIPDRSWEFRNLRDLPMELRPRGRAVSWASQRLVILRRKLHLLLRIMAQELTSVALRKVADGDRLLTTVPDDFSKLELTRPADFSASALWSLRAALRMRKTVLAKRLGKV